MPTYIYIEIFIKINNNINKLVLSTCSNEKFTRWRAAAKTNKNNSERNTENRKLKTSINSNNNNNNRKQRTEKQTNKWNLMQVKIESQTLWKRSIEWGGGRNELLILAQIAPERTRAKSLVGITHTEGPTFRTCSWLPSLGCLLLGNKVTQFDVQRTKRDKPIYSLLRIQFQKQCCLFVWRGKRFFETLFSM